ncbi:protein SENSITIVITY TO RED LIGHT REDUCED 1-like isoform X2 [Zingiber officinale]|uniref:protein SENSITIVITY TO RED LIGHT REDUCED 1-like isoform X2 n=1 Tax=Zingiber officinale TaxID=94328 RepID=UPI001C4BDE75|nr:protein SENSITIVITY TO RED LIGHT REDUCED 1-like isoform X2 [Zingiber officinale]
MTAMRFRFMAPEIPNPNSAGDWTIVSRRRRGRLKPHPPKNQLTAGHRSREDPPSPWIPLDPFVDQELQSRLLRRMESTIQRLEGSPFYRRFLHRLRGPLVQRGLARALSSASEMRMVVYGVGSIESSAPSRFQLALAVLLRRDLGPSVPSLEVFDPVLSATECAVLAALGGTVIPVDERGRREASEPTLFYMPHCEASLYDGLLEVNWRPSCLNRMVVLGNSFTAYDQYVELGRSAASAAVEMAARRLLQVRRYVTEVEMEEKGEAGVVLEQTKQDEEDGIFKAFHDTSWHFFELDDEANLDFLKQDFCG